MARPIIFLAFIALACSLRIQNYEHTLASVHLPSLSSSTTMRLLCTSPHSMTSTSRPFEPTTSIPSVAPLQPLMVARPTTSGISSAARWVVSSSDTSTAWQSTPTIKEDSIFMASAIPTSNCGWPSRCWQEMITTCMPDPLPQTGIYLRSSYKSPTLAIDDALLKHILYLLLKITVKDKVFGPVN